MGHAEIVDIQPKKSFTFAEAQAVSRLVYHLTEKTSRKVDQMVRRLESLSHLSPDLVSDAEKEINAAIEGWQRKVERLGGVPRGLWLADFDSGDGYYCWKYPETCVQYWHGYREGYTKRILITEQTAVL